MYRKLVQWRMVIIGHTVKLETDNLMFLILLLRLVLKLNRRFDITLVVVVVVVVVVFGNHFHDAVDKFAG